jgi:hypothetical protein
MYQGAVNPAPVQEASNPMLKQFGQNLSDYLSTQQCTINRIQSRLHDILNLRKPEQVEKPKDPAITDFAQFCEARLQEIYANNRMLDEIEAHLLKIIG